ncbi:MAG: class I SAM-dependent methyltransferase [Rhodanobacteraceae bacterium]|nr:MAG: class I SAM-dependent methyltransferase [Rhodanobacteraceae bacterium]
MLTHEQARAFYDRFGSKQDWQRFYEDRAVNDMISHGAFDTASSVFEFGCGTGRLAERLLMQCLPQNVSYLAIDSSPTMINLAQNRLSRFQDRAKVRLSLGDMALDVGPNQFDRFVCTYVMDLLAENDIRAVIREAHRVLAPNGLLCLVSLTHGYTTVCRFVEKLWVSVHSFRPVLVGGCRPVLLHPFLEGPKWNIRHENQISNFGLTSQIIVAEKVAT